MNTNTTGAPDGAAPDPTPPLPTHPANPVIRDDKSHDEIPHRPKPPAGRPTTFDTFMQAGWMLLIVVTLSEKSPVALIALAVAAAYCVRQSRR